MVSPGAAASIASCTGVPGPGGTTTVVAVVTRAGPSSKRTTIERTMVRIMASPFCLCEQPTRKLLPGIPAGQHEMKAARKRAVETGTAAGRRLYGAGPSGDRLDRSSPGPALSDI